MDHIRSIAERIAQDFVPPENPVTPSAAPQNRFGLGDPDCPICHGIGFVIKGDDYPDSSAGKMVPCQCRVKMFESVRKQSQTNSSNIQGYERMTFDTFNVEGRFMIKEADRRKLADARDKAMAFAQNPEGWLFFTGRYGTGKTHLAAAIANDFLSRGKTVLFQPVPDLLDQLREGYGSSNESYADRFERVRTTPLLVLDDLGAQNTTDWAEEKLYQIFNYRYVNQLPTVITSNANISRIDGRISSRLGDVNLTKKIEMDVPSYRKEINDSDDEFNISKLDILSDRTFENFYERPKLETEASKQLKTALAKCRGFAEDTHGWLVLAGPSGIGKMHLAAAVGNKCKKDGDKLCFVTASDLLDYLRATYNPNSIVTYDAVFDRICKCELLILNYLDTMNATSWAKEKIYQIINYRYQTKLPTMITLQKPVKEIDRNIRSRLLDSSLCTIVNMFDVPMYYSDPDEGIKAMINSRSGKNQK